VRWRAVAARPAAPWLLAVAASLTTALALAAPQEYPPLEIIAPEDGSYVSGETVLAARVLRPPSPVMRVRFFVDGEVVCTIEGAPFRCPWNAGDRVTEHQVRAVAYMRGGERLVTSVRTAGLEYTEVTDVFAVALSVVVIDEQGEFVRGLGAGDFRVYEDDVEQHLTYFAAEDVPLDLVVAIDISRSMADAMAFVKAGVKELLSGLAVDDRVTITGFNDAIFTIARPETPPETRSRAIDRLAPFGGTALYDTIIRSLDSLGQRLGRSALVLFTDGDDQSSYVGAADAEARLRASEATLFAVGQGRALESGALRKTLTRMAETSGGSSYFMRSEDDLRGAFAEVLEQLSHQYFLVYEPENRERDGAWRALRVELEDPRLRVRSRQGYTAAAPRTE